MTIEQFLAAHFSERGWEWSLKGRGKVVPTEEDFKVALDEAAKILYSEDSDTGGNMLEIGRLIIRRQGDTFDVYVLAGTF